MWSLRRGPYPAISRGGTWAITPQQTDALQDGQVDSLPPGPAWVSKVPKGGEKLLDRLRETLGERGEAAAWVRQWVQNLWDGGDGRRSCCSMAVAKS